MKSTIIIVAILTILFNNSFAQQDEIKSNISGVVVDKETQQPLPSIRIWLEGTSIGSFSDSNGNFTITSVRLILVYLLSFKFLYYFLIMKSVL